MRVMSETSLKVAQTFRQVAVSVIWKDFQISFIV